MTRKPSDKTIFRSKIDWWVWAIILFSMVIIFVAGIGSPWSLTLILAGGMLALFIVLIFGCWYEVVGDTLVVYQFFYPHRFPISKIKEVKKTTGYLATAGMSSRRVSIKFTSRAVLKSSMPLEISPARRDAFISKLISINPSITTGN